MSNPGLWTERDKLVNRSDWKQVSLYTDFWRISHVPPYHYDKSPQQDLVVLRGGTWQNRKLVELLRPMFENEKLCQQNSLLLTIAMVLFKLLDGPC